MKVYHVIGSYDYEGSNVLGVFSSPELAEAYKVRCKAAKHRGADNYDVQEWDVDELIDHEIGPIFAVRVDLPTGALTTYGTEEGLRHPWNVDITDSLAFAPAPMAFPPWTLVKSPISIEHAVKVATEMRQLWLRTHPLVTNS